MVSRKEIIVDVEAREATGKNRNRRLRVEGQVPGIVYGLDREPFAISVAPRRVEELLRREGGRNTLFKLSMGGGGQTREVMIRDLQRDPLTERLLHVDFMRVDPTKRIHVRVPVRLTGLAEGVKNEGGVLDFVTRDVEVACLPAQIPDALELDVSALHVGQHLSVKDIAGHEGVDFLEDPEAIIAVVAISRAEVSAAEEAVEEGAEAEAAEGEAEPAEKEGGEPDQDKS